MKFLVIAMQAGRGCDYTIGCGTKCEWIEAASIEEAEALLLLPSGKWQERRYEVEGEREIERLLVLPEPDVHEVNIAAWQERFKKERAATEHAEREAAQRALYEELKAKFDKGGGR